MIPIMNIIAWSASAPWGDIRQVEQDLIISRALIELFGDAMLARELRCSGVCNCNFMVPMRTTVAILSVSATCSPAATGRAEIYPSNGA